jgi:hypothetical protein
MKTHLRFLWCCAALLCVAITSRGQLSGPITVPSTTYPTLAVAIDSLNRQGVGTGGVVVTVNSNETAPVGGYQLGSAILNASTGSGKKVVINGTNKTLTAYVGTSTSTDGIFYIQGTDYVEINNLNLAESSANTTATTQMEWGYSLVKLSSSAPYDGCQYVKINGCTITLDKTNANTIGIRGAHTQVASTSTLSTSGVTPASTNSYCEFTSNTISGTTRGVSLVGINNGAVAYDKANKIGGAAAANGNTITYGGSSNTGYGVFTQYDSVITVSNNKIYIGSGNTGTAYGYQASTGVGDLTVTYNQFDLSCANTSNYVYGYYNSSGHRDASSGAAALTTQTISQNIVTGSNAAATSGYVYGLYSSSAYCKNMIFTFNQVKNMDWGNGTGYMYLLYESSSSAPNIVIEDNLVTNIDKRGATGYFYGVYMSEGSAQGLTSCQRNIVRGIRVRYYMYPQYYYGGTTSVNGISPNKLTVRSNVVDTINTTGATNTLYIYNYFGYYGGDSSLSADNVVSNIFTSTVTTGLYNYFGYYGYYAPNKYESRRNRVENIQVPAANFYNYNYFGYYGTLADSNVIYKVNHTGGSGYMFNDYCNSRDNSITSNNRIQNINLSGSMYFYNYLNQYCSNTTIRNNVIDSIAYVSGTSYPFYPYPYGSCTVAGNRISNFYLSGSPTIYAMYLNGGSGADYTVYNNIISNINVPSGYSNTTSCGIYCNSYQTTNYRLYHNTVRINSAVPAGFTGLYYDATSNIDLRNNILHVNATPTGSGFTTALRRNGGTGGTPPLNFLPASNGNIYYAPTATNSWLYGEGNSAAGMVNTYSLTNDPNFNTPCGLFKNFVSHDFSSFTENNLIAGTQPGTYVPTGISFAEKGAVPTPVTITTDYVGATRGALADIGALEFAGTALDQAPPVISFTAVPTQSYCVTTPSIVATITDVTGVNNTPGTAPRLYYKKSNGVGNDANTFTAANTSAGNGWKYVEATSVSGNQYTFNFDYSLLRGPVVAGDSLTYFIIAQDNALNPNTGFNLAAFTSCPSSVTLNGTNGGALKDTPIANGFRIMNTPVFRVDAFPAAACQSGSTVLSIRPQPLGTTVQWQSATLTGTFADITGATSPTYATPVQSTTIRYRAVIFCGSSTLATTTIDTFVIAKPGILTTAGMTTCGFGPATLSATTTPFSIGKWYDSPTGNNVVGVGNTFVTPNISSTRTYYVSAVTANANVESPGPTRINYSWDYSVGTMDFQFKNAFTDFYSTTVYPWTATPGATVDLDLLDSAGNAIPAYPTFTFAIAFAGNGSTPQVVNLPWRNIPRGKYTVQVTPNGQGAKMHMYYNLGAPLTSPSGATVITGGIMYGTATNYLAYLYNNIVGADCESSTRVPVVATVTPAPPIVTSSPNVPGICLGASATLNVTSANPDYVYTWTPGSTIASTVTVNPTVTTTYRVTAQDPYTGCRAVDSIKLYVNAQPAPPTITPNPATICAGKSVQLNGNPPLGSAGVGQIGTTTTSSSSYPTPWGALYTGAHTQYLYTQAELATMGIFPGHLINSYGVFSTSAGGTMQNFTIQLGTTTATSTSGSMICPTGAGQLTLVHYLATYTPPSSGWVTFSFNQTAYTYTGGTLIVDITHMNCTTCPTSSCNSWTSNGGIAVTNTPNPMVNYAYADGNCAVTTCTPSNTYTSTSRASAQFGFRQPADINWLVVTDLYKNSGLTTPVTLADTIRYPYAAPSVTTVYRAITNLQGCKSLPSAPDTVFVVPSPNATITPVGKQTICAGQTVTMCVPTAVNQTYQWTRNGTAIAGATSNCYTATSAGAYGVTVSNLLSGCSRTSLNDTVVVNPAPTVTVTRRGAAVICKGLTDTLTASGTNIVSYQWKESGVNIAGATNATLNVTSSGVYTVEVTNTDGCTATSASETITVNVTPTTITPLGPTTFCNGNTVTLQAPAAPTGVTFTYQWRQNGANITGATASTYTAGTTGSYTVVVTNTTTGCRDSSSATVVNVGNPPSSLITPNGNVVLCTNGSVTLTATAQPGLSYQWYNGTTAIGGATNPTYTATASGTYTVEVSITSAPSCKSQGQNNAVLTLTPLPTATATAAGPVNFCQGQSVVINAATGTGFTYQWNLNGAPISGQTGSSITATTSGNYTYTVTNTATGCTNVSNIITVNVSQPPASTVTPSGATTFCQGGNVNLCVATGAASYAWRLNGNLIANATTACYTATATGIYSVTVGGGNGCSVTSAPTSVQVNALPNVTTVPTGNAAVCQGYSIALTVGNDPNYSYQWLLNNVNITNNAQSATYNASAAGTYKVRVTNNVTGCSAVSADIILSVNTPPTATATLVGPSKICQADSTRIDAGTGPGFVYQWRLNGVNIAGATNATFYAKQSGSYTVNVSNAANCFNISNPIVITVDPRPAAYITYATPLEFCEGSAVVLTANVGQGLTYQWLINGTPNGNTDVYNVSKTTGRYALRVTNNFNCSNTSDTLNVVVYPAPVPTIVRNGTSLETATPYVSYQWFLNNDAIGGATSQSYAYNQNGAYKVRVIDMYGCEGTSNLFFVTNVGVGNTAVGKSIRIYPNPTTALINIEASVKVKVALRDVAGKTVLEASDVKQINLGDIANGMYMLYISDMNGVLLRAEKVTKTAN